MTYVIHSENTFVYFVKVHNEYLRGNTWKECILNMVTLHVTLVDKVFNTTLYKPELHIILNIFHKAIPVYFHKQEINDLFSKNKPKKKSTSTNTTHLENFRCDVFNSLHLCKVYRRINCSLVFRIPLVFCFCYIFFSFNLLNIREPFSNIFTIGTTITDIIYTG